jgi:hypothetical protein
MTRTSNRAPPFGAYFAACLLACCGAAVAEQAGTATPQAPTATPQSPSAPQPPSAAPAPVAKAPPSSNAQRDAGEPRVDTRPASGPADETASPGDARTDTHSEHRRASPAAAAKAAVDRVDLSTATVTGSQEQPKVMYVVPWKRSDIGDNSGKPMNSLLDEALAPVDRDEFKREVAYYDALQSSEAPRSTGNTAAQGEK